MNGPILIALALLIAVLAIDTEKPGSVFILEDILRGKDEKDDSFEISVGRRT